MTNGWKTGLACGAALLGTLATASTADAFWGRRHGGGCGSHGGYAQPSYDCDPCAAPVADCGSHGGFAHRHRGLFARHHGGGCAAPVNHCGSHGGVVHAAPACDSCGSVSTSGCSSCSSGGCEVGVSAPACENCHSGPALAPVESEDAPPSAAPTDAPPQPSPSDAPADTAPTGTEIHGESVLQTSAVAAPSVDMLAANGVPGHYIGSSGVRVVIGMPSSDKPTYGNYGRIGGPNVRYRSGLRY